MHVNNVKTYACRPAIANSNPISASKRPKGIIWNIANKPPAESIVQAKPAIIFSNVWPDVIFANNRIDNVKTLTMYERNSMVINKGTIGKGTPLGKNSAKNLNPWVWIPIILIPKKIESAKPKVNVIWLVTVKL